MARLSIRRGGITFYPNSTFEFQGKRIPEAELMKLAEITNITLLVKQTLAAEYLRRMTQQFTGTTHATTQPVTSQQ